MPMQLVSNRPPKPTKRDFQKPSSSLAGNSNFNRLLEIASNMENLRINHNPKP
jgi:hypothetical protein